MGRENLAHGAPETEMSHGLQGLAYKPRLSEGAALGFPRLVAVTPHPTRACVLSPEEECRLTGIPG